MEGVLMEATKKEPAARTDGKPEKMWDSETVMGIKGELFTLMIELLHDISSHFNGKSYTIEIDVSPEWVKIRKIARE